MTRPLLMLSALVLIVAACGDDSSSTTTATASTTTSSPTATTSVPAMTTTTARATTTTVDAVVDVDITVVGSSVEVRVEGQPETGRVEIATGAAVRITVDADVTDEVHVHGYDLAADVAPGQPAVIEFTADIPGIFEVELEGGHRLLVELQVS